MNSNDRRMEIQKLLTSSNKPIKGIDLAKQFGVTRQVIVKDIAIIRAAGENIIATPDGYMIYMNYDQKIRRVIAVSHSKDDIMDELSIIIKNGGMVEDVIVEHPVYGEIRAMLMLKTIKDLERFMERFLKNDASPLSMLTGGIHLHTVITDDDKSMDNIIEELKDKKIVIT